MRGNFIAVKTGIPGKGAGVPTDQKVFILAVLRDRLVEPGDSEVICGPEGFSVPLCPNSSSR